MCKHFWVSKRAEGVRWVSYKKKLIQMIPNFLGWLIMGYETLPQVDKIYGGVEVGFWIKWPGSGRFGNFLNLKSCIGHGYIHAYMGYT